MRNGHSLRQAIQELRPILADMAQACESSSRVLKPNSPVIAYAAHLVVLAGHGMIWRGGKFANHNYKRKALQWPFNSRSISVLGWGQEKIAYRVSPEGNDIGDRVVSVYHRESMGSDPLEVIHEQKKKYEIYGRYFGSLIVPTFFAVIDNPWGDGGKPASIQPFLRDTERFSDYSADQLSARGLQDPVLVESLGLLIDGYRKMLEDNLCPDFGGSNLVITDEGVRIFDTGLLLSADKAARIRKFAPSYRLVEEISG